MARLAWAALALALLAHTTSCTRRTIDTSDGGTDLARANDLASAGCELRGVSICAADPRCEIIAGCCGGASLCIPLGTEIRCAPCPPACQTLDEKACRGDARCRADYCLACACVPTFVACRDRSRAPDPCPLYDCAEPVCDCDGLGEAACKAAAPTRGCRASYCPDCAGGQYFNHCLSPRSGGAICPAVCPDTCRSDANCSLGQRCLAPGESAGCGACYQPDKTCVKDEECGDSLICDVAPCSCVSALSCIPGCQTTSDCIDGNMCGSDHRCQPRACSTNAPCPIHFFCQSGSTGDYCQRKTCTNDGGCPAGYCVEGFCHSSLGICSGQPI